MVLSVPARTNPNEVTRLTNAEREVIELALAGLSNLAIAEKRGTSANTVANQLKSVYRKLDCNSRREALIRIRRAG